MSIRKKRKSKSSWFGRIIILVLLIAMGGTAMLAYRYYGFIYQPNVVIPGKKTDYLYIPTGSDMQDVIRLLYEKNYIINRNAFEWVMKKKKYATHVHAGRYLIRAGMNNNELIDLLRSGRQSPVRIAWRGIRSKAQFAGRIGRLLEADSVKLMQLLNDEHFCRQYGFTSTTIMTMFLPDSYEFYWNTSAGGFIERMAAEYKKFWNEDRKQAARSIGLSQSEVCILAGIVQLETSVPEEMPVIAGVYLNRLKKNMLLQADPTVVFAVGDFSIRRVLNIHKEIDSPYNTYKYPGLPPGPICMASKRAIDAVLHAERHHYLYFCAREDFSGYHNFARTYAQHLINARKYQAALNKRNIYR